jgi:hypothetical protein
MDHVSRFNNGDILAARQALQDAWELYDLAKISPERRTPDVLYSIFQRIPLKAPEDRAKVQRAVATIADFFDGVYACRQSQVCDEDVLDKHLGNYSHSFYCIYRPAIESERQKIGNDLLGHGLRELSGVQGDC